MEGLVNIALNVSFWTIITFLLVLIILWKAAWKPIMKALDDRANFVVENIEKAKKVKPSNRGELEITSINDLYLKEERLKVELIGRGYAWLDTGTHESLLEASMFIQTIEKRQGLKVACVEEIAYEMGYIDKEKLFELAQPLKKNQYGQYLLHRAEEGKITK